MSDVDSPRLVRSPPGASPRMRRRTLLVTLVVGMALLLGLVLWGLAPRTDDGRPVVLVSPEGSRVSLDGRPVPSLGSDGTYLLRIDPGVHDLAVTLRNQQVIEHSLEVGPGDQALRLEVRYDRAFGRWSVLDVDADSQP